MKKTYEVVAAVIEKDRKIFCAQRGPQKSLAYKWEFPGGKIEKGESHHEALIREIKEELKTLINVKNHIASTYYEYKDFNIFLHSYYCQVIEGDLEITEHIDSKWIDKDEIDKLDWAAADIETVNKIMTNK